VELLFALAILAAVVAVVVKKVRTGPDFVEDRAPRIVASHREIDDALPRKCACGGRFYKEGEGTRSLPSARRPDGVGVGAGVDCVRVLVACDKCERRRALLFTLAS
jgi:hypothetical protein